MPTVDPLTSLLQTKLPSLKAQRRGKFRPSKKVMSEIFQILNESLFENQLVKPSIKLCTIPEWGWCIVNHDDSVKIQISNNLSCVQWFVLILAHEMVHQYQWEVAGPIRKAHGKQPLLGHGPSFFMFKKKMAKYGIPLRTKYCHVKWLKHQDLMKC